jgi:hypothetical protein
VLGLAGAPAEEPAAESETETVAAANGLPPGADGAPA